MTDDEFMQWLRDTNRAIVFLDRKGEDEWVSLERLLFHYTIKVGVIGDTAGYDDRWCVGDLGNAVAAYEEWKSRDFAGEPTRWNRHPKSGRRRPDFGDKDEEIRF